MELSRAQTKLRVSTVPDVAGMKGLECCSRGLTPEVYISQHGSVFHPNIQDSTQHTGPSIQSGVLQTAGASRVAEIARWSSITVVKVVSKQKRARVEYRDSCVIS
jgi:hypothetical protein